MTRQKILDPDLNYRRQKIPSPDRCLQIKYLNHGNLYAVINFKEIFHNLFS